VNGFWQVEFFDAHSPDSQEHEQAEQDHEDAGDDHGDSLETEDRAGFIEGFADQAGEDSEEGVCY